MGLLEYHGTIVEKKEKIAKKALAGNEGRK
jgi:hypothetical protein